MTEYRTLHSHLSGFGSPVECPPGLFCWARRIDRVLGVLNSLVDTGPRSLGGACGLAARNDRKRYAQHCPAGRQPIFPFASEHELLAFLRAESRKPSRNGRGTRSALTQVLCHRSEQRRVQLEHIPKGEREPKRPERRDRRPAADLSKLFAAAFGFSISAVARRKVRRRSGRLCRDPSWATR